MKNISSYRWLDNQVHFLYNPVSKCFSVSAFPVPSRIRRRKIQDEKTTITNHVCTGKSIKLRAVMSEMSPLPLYLETVLSLSSHFSKQWGILKPFTNLSRDFQNKNMLTALSVTRSTRVIIHMVSLLWFKNTDSVLIIHVKAVTYALQFLLCS